MIMLSVLFLVAIVKSAGCEFVTGDGIGGTEINIGPWKGSDCVKACMSSPALYNGVTMKADGSVGCWCESGMTGVKSSASSYRTCFFKSRIKCADGIIISRSNKWYGCGHANTYECNLGGRKTNDGTHCCCKTGYTPDKRGNCVACESQYGSDKDYVISNTRGYKQCPAGFTPIKNKGDCEAAAAARGSNGPGTITIFTPADFPRGGIPWDCNDVRLSCVCQDSGAELFYKPHIGGELVQQFYIRDGYGIVCKYTRTSQEGALSSGAPPAPGSGTPQELSQESYVASIEADNRKLKAKNEELLTVLRSLAD